MPEEFEYVLVRFDFSFHFILDLSPHERKLFSSFMGMQVLPDPDEFESSLLDFPDSNQLTRGVWHESTKACEQDYTPRDLNSQWKSPLNWSVWSYKALWTQQRIEKKQKNEERRGEKRRKRPTVRASEANPIRQHRTEGDSTTRHSCDKTSMVWVGVSINAGKVSI
jgi:hypothetical protein